ncbi:formyltetrahydrofolate deformylase [Pseudomonas putida]|uniref:Formyltetrahydrofolate deformylase n=1 Tax=Pseudomonas parafulva TaxID=157782 RepID=A0AAJ0LN56_9PSED|nr:MULTISPECIES: formyltetrahydrofolate deformylase [Pseudomonas]AQW70290.1 formyltetrahydrofolate deformylase [Pseudomonas parafulva]KTT18409.1 formyltetrahydrofolate deformylase [Pseudomonas parafulva]MBF8635477.1 formyltetrahydrofolate deformylase [Pseudomonas fulva]MBF8649864.1 formyltetrahydrofolate deformylase [Pseudomonas putida]MBF8654116.1 formyltetrahydrofolate deformylase [Pseudomonas putida]
MSRAPDTWILTADCPSMLGTVDVVTRYLFEQRCYVTEHHSFDDRLSGRFFIRVEFRVPDGFDEDGLRAGLAERSEAFGMAFELTAPNHRPKVVIMVSKADHCLNDLLYRQRIGQLGMDVAAVVSNHPDLEPLAHWHKIPYYHFALDPKDKPAQERKVLQVIEDTGAELVILARYMQVLSPELCRQLDGRAINIHHSLLPGFKGAKPYHQAYNKGVKMVGATAHYINNDLDEGPIIAQGVEVVDHTYYPEDLIAKGRDIECLTLARAVGYHIERRVFLNANRTVVL